MHTSHFRQNNTCQFCFLPRKNPYNLTKQLAKLQCTIGPNINCNACLLGLNG